jgi:hypothetical protein
MRGRTQASGIEFGDKFVSLESHRDFSGLDASCRLTTLCKIKRKVAESGLTGVKRAVKLIFVPRSNDAMAPSYLLED